MSTTAENECKWYVIHTYSGYENKVLNNINSMVEDMGLQDLICDVRIPVEEVVEIKNDKRKVVQHKLFPSYVMVKMVLTKRTKYIIRNIRGVTGFVGPGATEPVPLTNEEVRRMGIDNVRIETDVAIGDHVVIVSGNFEGYNAEVKEIDNVKQVAKVMTEGSGNNFMVELDLINIKKV